MPAPTLSDDLQAAIDAVRRVAAAHQVARLEAFGSAVTGRLHEGSDVDLLVSFRPLPVLEHGNHYFGLKSDLEALFGRRVDLLESNTVTNPYFLAAIKFERFLLYAAQ